MSFNLQTSIAQDDLISEIISGLKSNNDFTTFLLDRFFPVGSYYINSTDENPSSLLGGENG